MVETGILFYSDPLASKIESSLDDEVLQSKTLSIRPQTVDYKIAKDKVQFVYLAFDVGENTGSIEKLLDMTNSVKLAAAAETLTQTLRCIEASVGGPKVMVVSPADLKDLMQGKKPGKKGGISQK